MKNILSIAFLLVSSLIMAQWQNVGLGFTGGTVYSNGSGANALSDVHGMIVYNNDLYVWGDFDSVDGKPARNFARYDGSQWHALPFTGFARDMEIFQGELYIAGYTGMNSSLPGRYITKWDGSNWTALDSNVINTISPTEDGPFDLEVYKNELYLGGRSFNIGGPTGFPYQGIFNHVGLLKWTGSQWDSIVNGYKAFGTDYYFSLYSDSLIIASKRSPFLITGLTEAGWYFYDGTNWLDIIDGWIGRGNGVQLGENFFRAPGQIGTDTGQINFAFSSPAPSARIIKHDDKIISIRNFRNIQITDSNLNYMVIDSGTMQAPDFMEAICVYRDTLFVGGNFTTLGGATYNGIIKYEVPLSQLVITGTQEALSEKSDLRVYPNPTSETLYVRSSEIVQDLVLTDLSGKQIPIVYRRTGKQSYSVDISRQKPGLYILTVATSNNQINTKILIQ